MLPVTRKISILIYIFLLSLYPAFSQVKEKPFIKLTEPLKERNSVTSGRKYIVGSTCTTCSLMINGEKVKVYPTGAFAVEVNLVEGDSAFTLVAISSEGKSINKRIHYSYTVPLPAQPVSSLGIEKITTYPEGDLLLLPGDKIDFSVKAFPGSRLTVMNMPLYEMPLTVTGNMPGIYQGSYIIKATDTFTRLNIPVLIMSRDGQSLTRNTANQFSVMSSLMPDMVITKGRLAHLEYGLGEDRLGGAKIGYIDSLIALKVIGKVGSHYKVKLAKSRTAYIPEDVVTVMPNGTFEPSSLTDKWKVYGDSAYDYVEVRMGARLPYQSFQLIDPSRIVVDVFGATNNTNWITQLESRKEISNVTYEQIADDIFRINIQLKHKQHWGHSIYYRGNNLVIRVKQQPKELSLNKLTIAVDAGHGGTNTGAVGPTGVLEKQLTLAVALKLQKSLESRGAKVIMTRTTESFFDNKERILFYRDSTPDILVSIHLNSSGDPIRTEGTAMFYRYIGFKALNQAIYKQMLKLGLKEYGNNSSFNFMLNSPTEYPNALVEALFLSNPAEEMKALDENFQQQMAENITQGLKDFLSDLK